MKTAKPKPEGLVLRALRSMGLFPDSVVADPLPVLEKQRYDHVKEILFRKDPRQILACLGEKENLLCAAKLLLNEDYVFSSGWAISFAAKNGLDVSVAVPYLDEMVSHRESNARCYAVRALTQHYINTGDRTRLRLRMLVGGEDMIRETADAFLGEIGKGNINAIRPVLEALSDREPEIRKFSAFVLDSSPAYCTTETRPVLKAAILQYKLESPFLHISALRFMDDAVRSLDSQK